MRYAKIDELDLLEISKAEKAGMITAAEYMNLTYFTKKLELDLIKLKKENKLLWKVIEELMEKQLIMNHRKKNRKSPIFNLNFFR